MALKKNHARRENVPTTSVDPAHAKPLVEQVELPEDSEPKELSPDQLRFVDLFVQNVAHLGMTRVEAAKKAAQETGYARPAVVADRYFSHSSYFHVRDEANRQLALCEETKKAEHEISAERIIKELGRIAFHNPKSMLDGNGNVKDLKDMDDATARCMQVVGIREVVVTGKDGNRKVVRKLEVRPHPKLRALEQLSACLGLSTGKGQVNNKNVINVSWAEIFGPAATPQGGTNTLDSPDEMEKRIKAEEMKALPEHKENPVLYGKGELNGTGEDEYV